MSVVTHQRTTVYGGTATNNLNASWDDALHNRNYYSEASGAAELSRNGVCDNVGQVCKVMVCGLSCLPCASSRLISYYTGCSDPKKGCGIERCDKEYSYKGYNQVEYTETPPIGSGYSRKCLDIGTVVQGISCLGIVAGVTIPIIIDPSAFATTTTAPYMMV